jgi:hypothetical protein
MPASAKYEKSKFNNRVAQENARQAEAEGVAEAAYLRDRARVALGSQAAEQAESGFVPGIGSAVDALRQTATDAELSIMEARRKARARARSYRQQGALAKAEGDNALIEGMFGAANAVFGQQADYAADRKAAGYYG